MSDVGATAIRMVIARSVPIIPSGGWNPTVNRRTRQDTSPEADPAIEHQPVRDILKGTSDHGRLRDTDWFPIRSPRSATSSVREASNRESSLIAYTSPPRSNSPIYEAEKAPDLHAAKPSSKRTLLWKDGMCWWSMPGGEHGNSAGSCDDSSPLRIRIGSVSLRMR